MTEKDKKVSPVFLDLERSQRTGFSECIFCEGKGLEQICEIIEGMRHGGQNIFGTRATPEIGQELTNKFQCLTYHSLSRTFQWVQKTAPLIQGSLGILAAGTSDVPVAEEAYATLRFYGLEAKRFYDVGVAGIHRLFSNLQEIQAMDCVIVVAGMDGALASVVGGLVASPVIACPTSVGYGTQLKGFSTLAAMLNSCAEGVTVVNIDNGFGAACAALRILKFFLKKFQKKFDIA